MAEQTPAQPAAELASSGPRLRSAVRAVITDPAHRVLLVRFDFGPQSAPPTMWACPGGGLDPGEPPAVGLARELREEVGLVITDPGPPIWEKEHVFPLGEYAGQHDTYYWLEVEPFEPQPSFTLEQLQAEKVAEVRWWDWGELQSAQRAFDERRRNDPEFATFSPRRLGHLLIDLVETGRPSRVVRLPAL